MLFSPVLKAVVLVLLRVLDAGSHGSRSPSKAINTQPLPAGQANVSANGEVSQRNN